MLSKLSNQKRTCFRSKHCVTMDCTAFIYRQHLCIQQRRCARPWQQMSCWSMWEWECEKAGQGLRKHLGVGSQARPRASSPEGQHRFTMTTTQALYVIHGHSSEYYFYLFGNWIDFTVTILNFQVLPYSTRMQSLECSFYANVSLTSTEPNFNVPILSHRQSVSIMHNKVLANWITKQLKA